MKNNVKPGVLQEATENLSHSIEHVELSYLLWAGQFRDQIMVGSRFSAPVQTGPGAHLASYTISTTLFLGV